MTYRKILTSTELAKTVAGLRRAGKTIVYAQGYFDLLHIGHAHHLKQAKQLGEVLIVGVVSDRFVKKGPGRPIFKESQRLKLIAALECVDFVVLNDHPTAIESIKKISPDIFVKGEDVRKLALSQSSNLYREIAALKSAGGKVCYTKSLHIHSSELLEKFCGDRFKNKCVN